MKFVPCVFLPDVASSRRDMGLRVAALIVFEKICRRDAFCEITFELLETLVLAVFLYAAPCTQ